MPWYEVLLRSEMMSRFRWWFSKSSFLLKYDERKWTVKILSPNCFYFADDVCVFWKAFKQSVPLRYIPFFFRYLLDRRGNERDACFTCIVRHLSVFDGPNADFWFGWFSLERWLRNGPNAFVSFGLSDVRKWNEKLWSMMTSEITGKIEESPFFRREPKFYGRILWFRANLSSSSRI